MSKKKAGYAANYVDYLQMTPAQQTQVRLYLVTRNLQERDLPKWQFIVYDDGSVTKQKGRHKPTAEEAARWEQNAADIRRELSSIPSDPKKGGIRHFTSATFHLSK